MSFFPLHKLKGNRPVSKMATVHLAHLEEESTKWEEEEEIKDPDGIDGITEEFMVCLAQTMKDAQGRRSAAIIAAASSTLSVTAHY